MSLDSMYPGHSHHHGNFWHQKKRLCCLAQGPFLSWTVLTYALPLLSLAEALKTPGFPSPCNGRGLQCGGTMSVSHMTHQTPLDTQRAV